MKLIANLFILLILVSCSNSKIVYWCGDHECINKKERESFFEKNMTVQIKEIKKSNNKQILQSEKILKQAKIEQKKEIKLEKELKKQAKLEEKNKIKKEKELKKQAKLNEKRRIKEEKKLKKQVKLKEKKINEVKEIKKDKKVAKTINNTDIDALRIDISNKQFDELKTKIVEKNKLKPYPDINDIPN